MSSHSSPGFTTRQRRPGHSCVFVLFLFLVISLAISVVFLSPFGLLLPVAVPVAVHPAQDSSRNASLLLEAAAHSEVTVAFAEHDEYKNLSREYDHLWTTELIPANGGFLERIHGHGDESLHEYGITMFHQLHCLGMLREAFQKLLIGDGEGDQRRRRRRQHHHPGMHDDNGDVEVSTEPEDQESSQSEPTHEEHWLHCFDYLRQTILCAADTTIEPPKVNGQGREVVDGMGQQRQCRDWSLVYEASVRSDKQPERMDG